MTKDKLSGSSPTRHIYYTVTVAEREETERVFFVVGMGVNTTKKVMKNFSRSRFFIIFIDID